MAQAAATRGEQFDVWSVARRYEDRYTELVSG
jgi:hypothetical protein